MGARTGVARGVMVKSDGLGLRFDARRVGGVSCFLGRGRKRRNERLRGKGVSFPIFTYSS